MKLSSFATSLIVFAGPAFGEGTLTAQLDYGTFEGAYSSTYNISYWMKIPFGAPPVGKNRFRAPQPPLPITNGTYNSTQKFDFCPQRTVNGTEDCLYLGLYSRPWTSDQALRPVVVVFFGGAFIQGGGSFAIPPAGYPVLNVSDTNDFIFVYPNYRVNAFGFLPGKEIADDPYSDLNAGLLDQQAALQWTHKYIEHFGGDPTQVSIWGQSAGAGSVVAQVIANGGHTTPRLFNRALASSPFWPKTYKYDAPQAQSIYDTFASLTNCTGPSSLQCLKTVDVQTLRTAALYLSGSHTYNTSSYSWAPVIDGHFLREPLSLATAQRKVNIDQGFGMYNLHEGENFVPPGLQNATDTGSPPFNSTIASFQTWLRGYLPDMSEHNLQRVLRLYPASGAAEELVYNTSYVRAGLIYRDTVLACPAYWMARSSRKHAYVGEYTIDPARHGSDTEWWNQVNSIQRSDPLIYDGYTGAFASFFQTGDPNAHKLTNTSQPGVPESNLLNEEFVIKENGFTTVPTSILGKRCDFWKSVAIEIPE
ncbi:hypothetical protein LTR56_014854 [Elasticomyces elasticus]|nr:hypothetical protein LTR56_014854 [Elasticomyces elasticus]KAK3644688.1 hypothetical protein LTR22_015063 [Elasticomyces elasticus]KAK4916073.1 hypothetical protein LTR49_015847 [Elasticomyces elasticus]KAK5755188.1 hypothetical protein LTS12_014752 [Elasticomyces elasticus]